MFLSALKARIQQEKSLKKVQILASVFLTFVTWVIISLFQQTEFEITINGKVFLFKPFNLKPEVSNV